MRNIFGVELRIVLLWVCCWVMAGAEAQEERVLIHAHNDYHKRVPFYQAYAQRAYAIEADVFAVDGAVLVGHDREELQSQRTLESLYIKPIVDIFTSNGGRAWATSDDRFVLLIDLKTPATTTLQQVVNIIANYPNVFDERVNPHAVTVVISGAMPDPTAFANFPAYIWFDGRLGTAYTEDQLKRVAFVSASFSGYATWDGTDALTDKDNQRVTEAIDAVHGMGKKIRFWGTPDGAVAWTTLYGMGVDIINTDQIERCTQFFRERKPLR